MNVESIVYETCNDVKVGIRVCMLIQLRERENKIKPVLQDSLLKIIPQLL